MAIKVQCPDPACAKSFYVEDERAGKSMECPACGMLFRIAEKPEPKTSPRPPSDAGWSVGPKGLSEIKPQPPAPEIPTPKTAAPSSAPLWGGRSATFWVEALVLLLLVLWASGLSYDWWRREQASAREASIDPAKFELLYRAAKALEAATELGVNYQRFGELLQALQTELSVAGARSSTHAERMLVATYRQGYHHYHMSNIFWGFKLLAPRGAIWPRSSPPSPVFVEVLTAYGTGFGFDGEWYYLPEPCVELIWSHARIAMSKAHEGYLAAWHPDKR